VTNPSHSGPSEWTTCQPDFSHLTFDLQNKWRFCGFLCSAPLDTVNSLGDCLSSWSLQHIYKCKMTVI
jgi:hypothetical protein